MVNLKELEKMVDETLAKETKESWNKWLEEESMKEVESFLGYGILSYIDDCKFHSSIQSECINVSYVFEKDNSDEPYNDYKNAA